MCVAIVLVILAISGYSSRVQALDPENLPRQWQDLVSFVDQKIGHMESLVSIKDQRIDRLESKLQTQASEMTSLKRLMNLKDAVLTKLIKQVADLENRVDIYLNPDISGNIPGNNTQFSGESTTLSSRPSVVPEQPYGVIVDSHVQSPSKENGQVNVKLQDASAGLTRSAHSNRAAYEEQVAFHAYRTSTVTLGSLATVVFDHEALDLGNGYNPNDGIYVVPESGVYVITWTMISLGRCAFQNQLVVNGQTRGNTWTDSEEIADSHQVTGTVIIILNQGDHLFIRMGRIYRHGGIFSDGSYANPTFSGWKLA